MTDPAADCAPETAAEPLVRLAFDADAALATITLDSPQNRNALSRRLVGGLLDALAAADQDAAVRVVLIRSSGRVFCSGADLSEASTGGMADGAREIVRLQRSMVTMAKPVVVEVGGPVRAGGMGIVAAADIAVAATSASFALTEVKLGLAAAIISLTVHARMSPRAAALTTLGGEVFDGAAAAAYGLVTSTVEDAELGSEVRRICDSLAGGSPQGLRESKAILNRDLVARIDALGEEMAVTSARLFASPEAHEAMTAFLQRGR